MKLENQVTSLQISQRLHELGVKTESMFVHLEVEHLVELKTDENSKLIERKVVETKIVTGWAANAYVYPPDDVLNKWNAYTASELGELIPPKHYNFYKNESGYVFSLFGEPNTTDRNLANAIGKMLIHLLEQKLITVEVFK